MRLIYRRHNHGSFDFEWHYEPECPRWPQADWIEADYLDPMVGDRICTDCARLSLTKHLSNPKQQHETSHTFLCSPIYTTQLVMSAQTSTATPVFAS